MAAYTGPFPNENITGTFSEILVSHTNFSGSVVNNGFVSSGGILVSASTLSNGGIGDNGTIGTGGIVVTSSTFLKGGIVEGELNSGGIKIDGHSKLAISGGTVVRVELLEPFAGGISNAGTLSGKYGVFVGRTATGTSATVRLSNFSGGISNSGTISAATTGVLVGGIVGHFNGDTIRLSTFSGGITNSGVITAGNNGINVGDGALGLTFGDDTLTFSTFGGGISNSGRITAGGDGIEVGAQAFDPTALSAISTFSGGIANSGTISAGQTGIFVTNVISFTGGIGNNSGGKIVATDRGDAIFVTSAALFSGGVSNAGVLSVAGSSPSVSRGHIRPSDHQLRRRHCKLGPDCGRHRRRSGQGRHQLRRRHRQQRHGLNAKSRHFRRGIDLRGRHHQQRQYHRTLDERHFCHASFPLSREASATAARSPVGTSA